jgi:hypothetical protein
MPFTSSSITHLAIDYTIFTQVFTTSGDIPLTFLSDACFPALEELELNYIIGENNRIHDRDADTRPHPARLDNFPSLRCVKVSASRVLLDSGAPITIHVYTDFLLDCQQKGILQVECRNFLGSKCLIAPFLHIF